MLHLRVEEVARAQGISLEQLQVASGLSRPTVARYWRSDLHRITFTSLHAIARALNVPMNELLDRDEAQCASSQPQE